MDHPSHGRPGPHATAIASALALVSLVCAACAAPRKQAAGERPSIQDPEPAPTYPAADAEDESRAERDWSLRFRYPIVIGLTEFDLKKVPSTDNLATVAAVPTVEVAVPLSDEWTLLPFFGIGGGWLLDDHVGVWILTTGARVEWLHPLDEPTTLRVVPRLRYDVNLNRRDGLLGDWGLLDTAVEVRHAFGPADAAVRLEPSVFAQGYYFWDDIDFDQPGLAPESVQRQLEFGVGLGTRGAIEVFGIELPRVYLSYRFGDGAETWGIRFGEL